MVGLSKKVFPKLTQALVTKEHIFRIPPFNEQIVEAYKRIVTPEYNIDISEDSRDFLEIEQNAACWGEYEAMKDYFALIGAEKPSNVLEIGPGMGRSIVFLKKKFHWEDVEFHLYEGTGATTRYTILGPRYTDSLCGDIPTLRQILAYNGIIKYKIFDAKTLNFRLNNLPDVYDLIYSFYAIGFHWGLEHFLEEIGQLMHLRSNAFFVVHDSFSKFDKLDSYDSSFIDFLAAHPANKKSQMLVMQKKDNK